MIISVQPYSYNTPYIRKTTAIKTNSEIYNINKAQNLNFQAQQLSVPLLNKLFTRNNSGLSGIYDIAKGEFGTVCRGSIPLTNFWESILSRAELKTILKTGQSTNRDGFARSFLKASADVPISSSFIHDCSLMYLFNNNTNTHMLYHAESCATQEDLNYIIDTLMPEGFTDGIIKPGCVYFSDEHHRNLYNMFDIMKSKNPKATVNVYHDSSFFPEVVGYKGKLYEIPNAEVEAQQNAGFDVVKDYGQATFKIIDMQNTSTIYQIMYDCNSVKECIKVKEYFQKLKYPIEIINLLLSRLDKKMSYLMAIENAKTPEELADVERSLPKNELFTQALQNRQEDILIHKIRYISTIEDLNDLYEEASCYEGFAKMTRLKKAFMKKEEKIMT